jgi:4-amino-4-deoxy-L-arabinose transferase-like glycosyltransferase
MDGNSPWERDLSFETDLQTVGPQVNAPAKDLKCVSRTLRTAHNIRWSWRLSLNSSLFLLALLIYLLTRLVSLVNYPIYFFTDEAVQTVTVQDFLNKEFHGSDNVFFPTYFYNGYQYNLGTSVYLQVIPYLLFGKSVAVTRGVSALTTLLAALAVGYSLKQIFYMNSAWTGVLLLSITPCWFLHSRTAFETAEATAFYAGFLYCYLCYRTGRPRMLFGAVGMAALAFYTYSPMRMIVGVTCLLFFFADMGYHWQQRRVGLIAMALIGILALPFLRFEMIHPGANQEHLRMLNSYWVRSIPLPEKLAMYFTQYLKGFDPRYWYLPDMDMPRHVMKGYGNLLLASLPLGLIGIGLALKRFRQPAYRTVLLSLAAVPSGAALVQIGITRILALVVPMAILSGLALSTLLDRLPQRWRVSQWVVTGCFVLLAGFNFWMLRDALHNGPFWSSDYSLGGMQFGGQQVSEAIKTILTEMPGKRLELSPSWANGTDTIIRFFFNDPLPFAVGSIQGYLDQFRPELNNTLFVMTPEEFHQVVQSPKVRDFRILKILPYPNGQPGFYFVRLNYVENIASILEMERESRRQFQEETILLQGQPALVKYSYLDMGPISNIFDGNENTLIRTMEANPLQVQVVFERPRLINQLSVRVGGTPTAIHYSLLDTSGFMFYTGNVELDETPDPRDAELETPKSKNEVAQVLIEVKNVRDNEPAHVHLWEVIIQ